MLPSIFISHGAPTLALEDVPARRFLREAASHLPERPTVILVASAHWGTRTPVVSAMARNTTIHDFGQMFPRALFEMRYDAPGAPGLAERAADLLAGAGLASRMDDRRGLDHGAWVPLSQMYPGADIPVLQVSIQPHLGPAHHLDLGRALAPLRKEGVLIIGSGSFTHNLEEFFGQAADAPEPDWVAAFADWVDDALREGRLPDLLGYRYQAPFAVRNHPTDEHLLPLYVALGAAGMAPRTERLHRSASYGVLRMDAYAFTDESDAATAQAA
ncbi:class III extradiol ring-cleavage dioxygenase [Sediminicoccus sp. KRV36]|uniref:dioxygenase family protein n=1 Tax=Sediminicoccus sp. KRV36 TaxID=3133721 RepID=UPI00200C711A|nr:class III extradiol ring-cleavage dioxygenase [Sediminicoccus rosea]UPY38950.1 dioxygenase [Sediminicoccus rosea]